MKFLMHLIFLCTLVTTLSAGWQDWVTQGAKILQENSTSSDSSSSINNDYKTKALKEALSIGVEQSIKSLSGEGFLNHQNLKIPLPDSLKTITNVVSKFGGERYVNDFVKTLNLAAGKAVPKTATIFTDTISKMSINDATAILNGKNDAATSYFKDKTLSQLQSTIEPIVKDSTSQSGLISSYKTMMNFYNKNKSAIPGSDLLSQASSTAKAFGFGEYLPISEEDLDSYVTRKSIDGMFYLIAQEEKKIRQNPLNYGSNIIQKVFGK